LIHAGRTGLGTFELNRAAASQMVTPWSAGVLGMNPLATITKKLPSGE
jgi:hypothetical protein